MNFSIHANLSPAAALQESELSHDFMHGFNVEDDHDRSYLAELATRGIASAEDVNSFVHLSLLRGLEEWDQALCCASAIRDREYRCDSLDGQDLLAFLSEIYGVDGPSRDRSALLSPRKHRRLRARRGSERRKLKRAGRQRDSPYWNETLVSVPPQTANFLEELQGEALTEQPSRKRRKLSKEVTRQEKNAASQEQSDETSSQACQENTNTIRDDDGNGDGGTRHALFELDIPTLPLLDIFDEGIGSTASIQEQEMKGCKPKKELEELPVNSVALPPQTETPKRKVAKSPYFAAATTTPTKSSPSKSPNIKKRPPRGTVSSLPFPRLDAPRFGLIQEELATDPLRLLIAVTFLVRTSGKAAIPVFWELMETYPTPEALVGAPTADIEARIKHLGLGHVRAATIQRFARAWLEEPPRRGVGYAVRNYCQGQSHHCAGHYYHPRGNGEVDDGEEESEKEKDEEKKEREKANANVNVNTNTTSMWEIGHITQGPYALDSWRIFCRDVLCGEAEDWNGGGREGEFQPEWMRVLPRDKELRACLRWMWMREGFEWDPGTGDKVVLSDELRRAVQDGRVGYDFDTGDLRILDE